MTTHEPIRLKYASNPERQGFIELTPGIHPGCVNVETWHLGAESDLTGASWVTDLSDTAPQLGNTEIELSVHEARRLAQALRADAVRRADSTAGDPLFQVDCTSIEYRRGSVSLRLGTRSGGLLIVAREADTGWLTKVQVGHNAERATHIELAPREAIALADLLEEAAERVDAH
ncbi:MAG: hypothetical protein AAGM22_05335 [Acidobacteriota bacterium]